VSKRSPLNGGGKKKLDCVIMLSHNSSINNNLMLIIHNIWSAIAQLTKIIPNKVLPQ